MTKKDFELIAWTFSTLRDRLIEERSNRNCITGVEYAIEQFAHALKNNNPRFDRERFLEACGVN